MQDEQDFGIVMVMNLCVGLCTPAVGSVLFLGCTVSGSSITQVRERFGHPVLYVRALYTLGVLHSDLGDDSQSRDYFERFLEHWGDADWDLPEVRDARSRLQK